MTNERRRRHILKLNPINKYYDAGAVNEMCLSDGFNLIVEDQEFASVVGNDGSGKTSILNLICGSTPLGNRSIFVNEENIINMPKYRYQRHIGRAYQNPTMGTCPNMAILENMFLAGNKGKPFNLRLGTNKQRIDYYRESLETLGLGLEDRLHIKVDVLSGGQRQAVAPLISTMTLTEFLILDKHTVVSDPKTVEIIMELVDRIVREKALTTIMITHNLRYTVEYGNRLVMMHQGHAIIDKVGEEKAVIETDDILDKSNETGIECRN